jgi:tetratricopeptide (TPR) repeat protein
MKHYDQCIPLYRELIKKSADEPRLYYELGAVLNEAKQNDEAETALRKCLDMIPVPAATSERMDLRATVLNHLGYMFAEEGAHLEEAERLLTDALEIEPRAGFIVDSMGWLQFKLGNTEKALSLLKKALDYSSEDPTLYDHLGDVYAGTGDRQKALECWREALRLDPDLPKIKTKIQDAPKR